MKTAVKPSLALGATAPIEVLQAAQRAIDLARHYADNCGPGTHSDNAQLTYASAVRAYLNDNFSVAIYWAMRSLDYSVGSTHPAYAGVKAVAEVAELLAQKA